VARLATHCAQHHHGLSGASTIDALEQLTKNRQAFAPAGRSYLFSHEQGAFAVSTKARTR